MKFSMNFKLLSALLIIILNIIGYYIAELLLWLEFLLHPYTPVGMAIKTFGVHVLFAILSTIIAIGFAFYVDKRKNN